MRGHATIHKAWKKAPYRFAGRRWIRCRPYDVIHLMHAIHDFCINVIDFAFNFFFFDLSFCDYNIGVKKKIAITIKSVLYHVTIRVFIAAHTFVAARTP